ncbi:helix-turn-helix transcriptional regulator [Aquibium sp. ELW1220]|uniref:helix-turn-helix transcriptional regulator n=1 Tax=Aquibium sp. ELW1220 TaxID=2976766 RepID=UPI0025B1743B|nr:helix-turn-helix transcriptional regulator [Aquibium sp. ELW1220]MDN2584037.1 helix-turn-helix transcriptional regulator [Aquibium sp. ELW1220]
MEDFAGALVLAMVRRSLERQSIGLDLPPPARKRTIGLAEKRAFLDAVLSAHGAEAILGVAGIVPEFAAHPVAGVFAGCRSPGDIVASWFAIERYFHSRHRTRLVDGDAGRIVMEHYDLRGSPVGKGDSLAVAGLVLGILRWRGAQDAALAFDEQPASAGSGAPPGAARCWSISWTRFDPPPAACSDSPVPAVDVAGRPLSDPVVARLFAGRLAAPHARRPAAEVARACGLSLRTLQRRLADAGWTLADIVASARIHGATRLLAATDTPLSLVGLLAGYSDQPHFQRAFRAAVGPTPAEYRRLARPA